MPHHACRHCHQEVWARRPTAVEERLRYIAHAQAAFKKVAEGRAQGGCGQKWPKWSRYQRPARHAFRPGPLPRAAELPPIQHAARAVPRALVPNGAPAALATEKRDTSTYHKPLHRPHTPPACVLTCRVGDGEEGHEHHVAAGLRAERDPDLADVVEQRERDAGADAKLEEHAPARPRRRRQWEWRRRPGLHGRRREACRMGTVSTRRSPPRRAPGRHGACVHGAAGDARLLAARAPRFRSQRSCSPLSNYLTRSRPCTPCQTW